MPNFFIFGLPRSRTLWLSVVLSTDRALCLHDTGEIISKQTRDSILASDRYEYIGLSEPLPAQMFREINQDLLKSSPKVVIKNDLKETFQRVLRWQADDPDHGKFIPVFDRKNIERQADALAKIEQMPNCMAVSLKDLSDHQVINQIHQHCLPGLPFDPIRAKIMQDVVIVVPYPKMKPVVTFMHGRRAALRELIQKGAHDGTRADQPGPSSRMLQGLDLS